jgi:hypothetical protein
MHPGPRQDGARPKEGDTEVQEGRLETETDTVYIDKRPPKRNQREEQTDRRITDEARRDAWSCE